ncbi:MAG: chromosome partitioning protein [Actinomycetia bacterium]|nr:chromosome partitioning protein [Actinomycetes bacterium]
MSGIEVAIGYLFAWLVRKARRVGGRADAEVDRTLDTAMDHLHDLVGARLGEDPALERLADEAAAGGESPSVRTRLQVQLALEDAAEQDPGFRQALDRAVAQVRAAEGRAHGGTSVGGDVHIEARDGSAAAWTMGDVTVGNPPAPEPPQG